MDTGYPDGTGVDHVGVGVDEVGKVVDQIVNQAHVVVGVRTGKLYPFTTEDLVIGEEDAEAQSDTEEHGYNYAAEQFWGKPSLFSFGLFTHLAVPPLALNGLTS